MSLHLFYFDWKSSIYIYRLICLLISFMYCFASTGFAQQSKPVTQYQNFLLMNDHSWLNDKTVVVGIHQERIDTSSDGVETIVSSPVRLLEGQFTEGYFRLEEYPEEGLTDKSTVHDYFAYDGVKFTQTQSLDTTPVKIYGGLPSDFNKTNKINAAFALNDSASLSDDMEAALFDPESLTLSIVDKGTSSHEMRYQFGETDDGVLYLIKAESFLNNIPSVAREYSGWQFDSSFAGPPRPNKCAERIYDMNSGKLSHSNMYEVLSVEAHTEGYEIPPMPIPKGEKIYDYRTEPPLEYRHESLVDTHSTIANLSEQLDELSQNSQAEAPHVDWAEIESHSSNPAHQDHEHSLEAVETVAVYPLRKYGVMGLVLCVIAFAILRPFKKAGVNRK